MQSIESWLELNRRHENKLNKFTSHSNLRILLGNLLGKNNAWLYAHPEFQLSPDQIKQLDQWLIQLSDGLPIAYITGQQAFWDLNLTVTKHTLIPRPDTEILLETAVELMADKHPTRILDLGTGSGALALALSRIFPQAMVTAVDQCEKALAVAKHNAQLNQIDRVDFYQSNWFDSIPVQQFDLIVSNPPYIGKDDTHLTDLKHEPKTALIADQDGLGDFIRISNQAMGYLQDQGIVMFEHGWQQKLSVQALLKKAGFRNIATRKDMAGLDRVTLGYK